MQGPDLKIGEICAVAHTQYGFEFLVIVAHRPFPGAVAALEYKFESWPARNCTPVAYGTAPASSPNEGT